VYCTDKYKKYFLKKTIDRVVQTFVKLVTSLNVRKGVGMSEHILVALVLTIVGVSASSLRRLIGEDGFPKPEKVGRVYYFKTHLIYKWLSKKAGRDIAIGDKLLSAKDIERLFKRSSGWFWVHFIKNKSRKAKIIKIRSKNMWLESEVYADKELKKYLDVVLEEVA